MALCEVNTHNTHPQSQVSTCVDTYTHLYAQASKTRNDIHIQDIDTYNWSQAWFARELSFILLSFQILYFIFYNKCLLFYGLILQIFIAFFIQIFYFISYYILSLWLFAVRVGHWVCGESWQAIKDSLTHRPSSQGWAPDVLPFYVQVCCVCTWLEGGGWRVTSGFSFFSLFSGQYAINILFVPLYTGYDCKEFLLHSAGSTRIYTPHTQYVTH